LIALPFMAITACAQSSIQPMSQDTFKVATTAAPACGPNGARNVAFKTAAVEVIRKGADKFVLVGDSNSSSFWSGQHEQAMIVRIIPENSPEAANALSARGQLGADWQQIVANGAPTTCS
jgi:precorrin-6x reductase